jgi:hypothetical protein
MGSNIDIPGCDGLAVGKEGDLDAHGRSGASIVNSKIYLRAFAGCGILGPDGYRPCGKIRHLVGPRFLANAAFLRVRDR